MKEEYWNELLDIFFNHEELQKEHENLYKNVSLIVESSKKHKELEELKNVLTGNNLTLEQLTGVENE